TQVDSFAHLRCVYQRRLSVPLIQAHAMVDAGAIDHVSANHAIPTIFRSPSRPSGMGRGRTTVRRRDRLSQGVSPGQVSRQTAI
ncbi:hypothetical protein, partial [Rhizobium laguerreae]|uniref:hypothetical protein n=1 Tax=Rhizobium laguerreae TaxID=1076926 RepID=UPI001C90372B